MKRSPTGCIDGLPIAKKQIGAYGKHPTAYQQRIQHLLDQGPAVESPSVETLPSPSREKRHPSSCTCEPCWNAGVRYGDYLKSKALEDL
jgi:hypothetical protein